MCAITTIDSFKNNIPSTGGVSSKIVASLLWPVKNDIKLDVISRPLDLRLQGQGNNDKCATSGQDHHFNENGNYDSNIPSDSVLNYTESRRSASCIEATCSTCVPQSIANSTINTLITPNELPAVLAKSNCLKSEYVIGYDDQLSYGAVISKSIDQPVGSFTGSVGPSNNNNIDNSVDGGGPMLNCPTKVLSGNHQPPISINMIRFASIVLIKLILLNNNNSPWIMHNIYKSNSNTLWSNGAMVQCDIFSSTSHLQNLMYLERHLIMSLGKYVVNMEHKLSKIRRYIDSWEETAGRNEYVGTYSEEEIIGNPLQAFQLVKRLTIDWRTISDLFKQDQWNEVRKLTQDYKSIMPSDDDLHGAALAIVRLQDTYNLTNTELASGKIQEHYTRIQMSARDCLYLAKHAFNNAYYGHSLDWFEEAMSRAYREGNSTASVSEIQPFYQMATQVVDQFKKEYQGPLDTYHIYMEASGSKEHSTKFRMLEDDNEDYRRYQALCRGENRRTAEDEKKLKCYLTHNNDPYLYIQPVKLEVQNINPYIAMIHNLMTENEASTIRELAAPMLTRARVQTDNGTSDMVSKTRTSQTAWFSPDTHPIVTRMNRRIEAATGLSADMTDSHCELMQVANYGMGGHYTPHYDYLIVDRPVEERDQVDERELYAGDRTATVMFYLSDVVRGGSTVFPRLGVQLRPELGAAAFWFNLYRNGEGIIDTVHGACPVLMGEKWVANFWIRERGQFSKRPCSLNPKE